jgi:7,8-dihydro-6-hydroxymethylpterin-pyrophosphokinase
MREAPSRWLLLLGSNLDTDVRVRSALARLAARGTATLLTPIRRFTSDNGDPRRYYNALVDWCAADGGGRMPAFAHRLEHELGRQRDMSEEVAIDIDLLASFVDGQWHADAHALDKRAFARASVVALLREAGIDVLMT